MSLIQDLTRNILTSPYEVDTFMVMTDPLFDVAGEEVGDEVEEQEEEDRVATAAETARRAAEADQQFIDMKARIAGETLESLPAPLRFIRRVPGRKYKSAFMMQADVFAATRLALHSPKPTQVNLLSALAHRAEAAHVALLELPLGQWMDEVTDEDGPPTTFTLRDFMSWFAHSITVELRQLVEQQNGVGALPFANRQEYIAALQFLISDASLGAVVRAEACCIFSRALMAASDAVEASQRRWQWPMPSVALDAVHWTGPMASDAYPITLLSEMVQGAYPASLIKAFIDLLPNCVDYYAEYVVHAVDNSSATPSIIGRMARFLPLKGTFVAVLLNHLASNAPYLDNCNVSQHEPAVEAILTHPFIRKLVTDMAPRDRTCEFIIMMMHIHSAHGQNVVMHNHIIRGMMRHTSSGQASIEYSRMKKAGDVRDSKVMQQEAVETVRYTHLLQDQVWANARPGRYPTNDYLAQLYKDWSVVNCVCGPAGRTLEIERLTALGTAKDRITIGRLIRYDKRSQHDPLEYVPFAAARKILIGSSPEWGGQERLDHLKDKQRALVAYTCTLQRIPGLVFGVAEMVLRHAMQPGVKLNKFLTEETLTSHLELLIGCARTSPVPASHYTHRLGCKIVDTLVPVEKNPLLLAKGEQRIATHAKLVDGYHTNYRLTRRQAVVHRLRRLKERVSKATDENVADPKWREEIAESIGMTLYIVTPSHPLAVKLPMVEMRKTGPPIARPLDTTAAEDAESKKKQRVE
jgi:hypothetical protein